MTQEPPIIISLIKVERHFYNTVTYILLLYSTERRCFNSMVSCINYKYVFMWLSTFRSAFQLPGNH